MSCSDRFILITSSDKCSYRSLRVLYPAITLRIEEGSRITNLLRPWVVLTDSFWSPPLTNVHIGHLYCYNTENQRGPRIINLSWSWVVLTDSFFLGCELFWPIHFDCIFNKCSYRSLHVLYPAIPLRIKEVSRIINLPWPWVVLTDSLWSPPLTNVHIGHYACYILL